MRNQPKIKVGILVRQKLKFRISGDFRLTNHFSLKSGEYWANKVGRKVRISNNNGQLFSAPSIEMLPTNNEFFFEFPNVTIGIDFHWEQNEIQQFKGGLKLIIENDKVRAINVIDLEEYLKSVISSEMSSSSSLEFLKAHAVISRSWLLAQIEKTNTSKGGENIKIATSDNENEIVRWYDREDHKTFDVCADDHCQRYQGITKIKSENALYAVEETAGEILEYEGEICDARFSKCCGGISENFENVWQPVRHRYLTKVVDSQFGDTTCVDLRQEDEAEIWIRNQPYAFCKTNDTKILSQVLPDFDQTTTDFYRWKVKFTQQEISTLIKKRSGIDFGQIVKLEAVKRGHSSRIIKLKIVGTLRTIIVGKELEIRKWLSETHLYSSAFVIDHLNVKNGIPQNFVLTGAGWGHGVGLCQIGAAVLGEKGYTYKEILSHYYRAAKLKKIY